jgi:hypothetical protein
MEQGRFDIPDVKEVADGVDVRVGPEQDGAFGSGPTARIVAGLTDGRTVAAEAVAPGSPGNPTTSSVRRRSTGHHHAELMG